MASECKIPKKEEDSDDICGVCSQLFRGRNPKVLPCLHTFCLPCLTERQAAAIKKLDDKSSCKEDQSVSSEKSDPSSASKTENEGSMQPLQMCDTTKDRNRVKGCYDDARTAVFPCPTCGASVSVPEEGVHALPASPDNGQPTSVVCDRQKEDRQPRASQEVISSAMRSREEMSSLVAAVHQQIQVLESSLWRLELDEKELSRQKEEVTQQINCRHDLLVTWVNQSRDELLAEVTRKESATKSQISTEKAAASETLSTLSALFSRAAGVHDNEPDTTLLSNELLAAMLSEDRLDHLKEHAQRQKPQWGWRYDLTETSSIQPEMVQAFMGRIAENDIDGVSFPVSPEETVGKKMDRTEATCSSETKKSTAQFSSCELNTPVLEKNVEDLEQASTLSTGLAQQQPSTFEDDVDKAALPGKQNTDIPKDASEFTTKSGIRISVYRTDITKLPVDAIVNAANEALAHYGGVACAIAKAAGEALVDEGDEYIEKNGRLKVKEVVATTSGNLPCQKVLHAVGPRWEDYEDKTLCQQDLVDTVYNCLNTAHNKRLTSLALPSISSAIFGVPREICAKSYVIAVKWFEKIHGDKTSLRHIHFVDIIDDMVHQVEEAFKENWNTDLRDAEAAEGDDIDSQVAVAAKGSNSDLKDAACTTKEDNTELRPEMPAKGSHSDLQDEVSAKGNNSDSLLTMTGRTKEERQGAAASAESSPTTGVDDSTGPSPDTTGLPWNAADFTTKSGIRVSVYKADITKLPVDAIVNAANIYLSHGGGVAYAIASEAGEALDAEGQAYIQKNGPLEVSQVVATTGGSLPCKKVLHAVGPSWGSYTDKALCQQDLVNTVYNCLKTAVKMKFATVAIPSISSAIFGVPKDVCARSYLIAVQRFENLNGGSTCLRHIHFIDISYEMVGKIQETFKQYWNVDLQATKDDNPEFQAATAGKGENSQSHHASAAESTHEKEKGKGKKPKKKPRKQKSAKASSSSSSGNTSRPK